MKNLELVFDSVGMSDVRRKSIENQILKRAKIRIVAYKGGFDGLVSSGLLLLI